MGGPHDTTRLLIDLRSGDPSAREQLLDSVYAELRGLAGQFMKGERPDHTLQPTALAHEVYLRLIDETQIDWQSKAHFLAVASKVIRRILIEHARRRHTAKRGGGSRRVRLSEADAQLAGIDVDLLALDEALEELASLNERHHHVVELRFFGGLTIEETAHVLGVSTDTVKADWRAARAWLRWRLSEEENP